MGLVLGASWAFAAWVIGSPSPALAACSHSVCQAGSALPTPAPGTLGCSPCVSQVCAADPYCCNAAWDSLCVDEVESVCGSDECAPGAVVIDALDSGIMGTFEGSNVSATGPIWVSENTGSSDTRLVQWHKFDLSGVGRTIASAQLQLQFPVGAYGSGSSWVDLTVWDVTSSPSSFGFDFAGGYNRPFSPTVFSDLGSGTSFGTRSYTDADEGKLTTLPLNAAGVAAASAARGGVFSVGGAGPWYACFPPCSPVAPEFIFLNTGSLETDPRFGLPTVRRLVLVPPECGNGLDDDGDGLTDAGSDPGCAGVSDLSEHDPNLPCDDGADNDGDLRRDYQVGAGADPGCRMPTSTSESPQCQDGRDNDARPGIDFDGGASLDIDPVDGRVDAAFNAATPLVGALDPECTSAWRNREAASSCGLGFESVLLAPLLARLARKRREARAA